MKDNAKPIARTLAETACLLFGEENPDALREMAQSAVPPDAYSAAVEQPGMAIPLLCELPRVVDLFVPGAQLALDDAAGKAGLAPAPSTPCPSAPMSAPIAEPVTEPASSPGTSDPAGAEAPGASPAPLLGGP